MKGDIHIYIFFEMSNQQTHTNAQSVWFDIEHSKKGLPFGLEVNQGNNAEEFMNQFQITKIPSIVFVEDLGNGKGKTIAGISGNASYDQIRDKYLKALNGEFSASGDVEDQGDRHPLFEGDSEGFGVGFGLGLGGKKLGSWLLLAGAVALSPRRHKIKVAATGAGVIMLT